MDDLPQDLTPNQNNKEIENIDFSQKINLQQTMKSPEK